jgi:diguanylate cyclase (GGDEF)-like protein
MLSERLRDEVQHYPWHTLHPELEVTVSFGVASVGKHATAAAFLAAADQRLYAAKRAGRNRVMA